jgi:hypothetical protein
MCLLLARTATSRYHPAVTPDRREFLKRAAMTAAATSADPSALIHAAQGAPNATPPRATDAAQPPRAQPSPRTLDAAMLAAVGEAVLPESLGASARSRAVAAFARWLAQYTPVAEEMHGYGYAEITYTPSDPAPGWAAQLAGLDLLARRKHRRGFARLGVPLRRAVLQAQIGSAGGTRLPSNPLSAPHVAVALMAHWAASSEATDLAYQARILKGNCRSLADTARRPLPLAGAEGA